MSGEIEREVLAADDARYRAMIEADYATLERVLGDDLVYTHDDSESETKSEHIARMRFGNVRYRGARRRSAIVRLYGRTAVMHGQVLVEATCGGVERTSEERFLNVWVRRHAGWQMVAGASTRIPKRSFRPASVRRRSI